MIDYLRAEGYKVSHRAYPLGFLLAMFLCEGLLVSGWVFTNAHGNHFGFSSGAFVLTNMLEVGIYCTIITSDMVFSDQYRSNTLKNEVSFGIPRTRIFLGKLMMECIVAVILCLAVVAFYIGACYLFLPHDPQPDAQSMRLIGYSLLASLPLWLGEQALANMVYFLVKSSAIGSFVIVGIAMGGQLLKILGALVHPCFQLLYSIMLNSPFERICGGEWDWAFLGQTWAVGAAWFLVTTAVGLFVFRKKEIN